MFPACDPLDIVALRNGPRVEAEHPRQFGRAHESLHGLEGPPDDLSLRQSRHKEQGPRLVSAEWGVEAGTYAGGYILRTALRQRCGVGETVEYTISTYASDGASGKEFGGRGTRMGRAGERNRPELRGQNATEGR